MIRHIHYYFFLLLGALSCSAEAIAQDHIEDSLKTIIKQHNQTQSGQILYVITDKQIYAPGETLWLAGYLLERWPVSDTLQPDILAAGLRKEGEKTFILTKSFLIQKGISPGSWHLPDSLSPGTYELLFATNLINKDSVSQQVYRKEIIIGRYPTIASKNEKDFNKYGASSPVGDSLCVKFYPEGGDLVAGIDSRVGWEVKRNNIAVHAKAILYENDTAIDTIVTNKNGLGIFRLQPKKDAIYAVVILDSFKTSLSQRLNLPQSLSQGAVLELPQAVTDSSLSVYIRTTRKGIFRIGLRQLINNEVITTSPFEVDDELKVSIDLNNAERGLISLTLLDEYGRPLAERLGLANYSKKVGVDIITDKDTYGFRDSISVKPHIKDAKNTNIPSLFTISCVHLSRVDSSGQNNMANYFYLNHWLGKFSENALNIPSAIDTLLLIRGWRRYTWQEIFNSTQTSQVTPFYKAKIMGRVISVNGKIKESIDLLISGGSFFSTVQTDTKGYFYPKPESIAIPEDRALFIKPTGKYGVVGYKAVIKSPENDLLKLADAGIEITKKNSLSSSNSDKSVILSDVNFAKQLETVVVKSRSYQPFITKGAGANECGDYVCTEGYLNCPRHPANFPKSRQPVKGEKYYTYVSFSNTASDRVQKTTYKGCLLEGIRQGGVYTAREFYGMDSSLMINPDEKVYMSTIFWKPFLNSQVHKHTSIEFYTSDQLGVYKITIQGVTINGDVFYAEKMIKVKE